MMVNFSASARTTRRGLTLMELVVVLAVLAALAAILIPLFPNLLRRAHKVTDATQSSEVAKCVQLYQALYTSYPDQFDSMVDAGGAAPAYIPADGGTPFAGAAVPGPLTANEVAALGRVGITSVHNFATTLGSGGHPTMNPYGAAVNAPTPLTPSTNVFIIDPATTSGEIPVEIQNIIARDGTARFVVFGVGPRSTMVGKVMQNAPTSVPQNASFTPATLYSRVGVVFQVSGLEMNVTQRARFIGAVALEDDELESTEKDMVGYYDVATAEAAGT